MPTFRHCTRRLAQPYSLKAKVLCCVVVPVLARWLGQDLGLVASTCLQTLDRANPAAYCNVGKTNL